MATPTTKDWRTLLSKIAQSKRREDVDFVNCLEGYLQTGDPNWASKVALPPLAHEVEQLGAIVGATYPWGEAEQRAAEFAAALFRAHPSRRYPNYHGLLDGIMKEVWSLECDGKPAEGEKMIHTLEIRSLGIDDLLDVISWNSYVGAFSGWVRGWQRAEGKPPLRPTTAEKMVLEQESDVLVSGLHHDDGHTQYLLCAVAKERPEVARQWFEELVTAQSLGQVPPHRLAALVGVVEDYDLEAFRYLVECGEPSWVAELVVALSKRFSVADRLELRAAAVSPAIAAAPAVHDLIFANQIPESLAVLKVVLSQKLFLRHPYVGPDRYEAGYAEAARRLSEDGREIFDLLATNADADAMRTALRELLRHAEDRDAPTAVELTRVMLSQRASTGHREPLVGLMAELRPSWFIEDWWGLIGDPSKLVRAHAVASLAKVLGVGAVSGAADRLASRKSEMRLGCVGLLAAVGGSQAVITLRATLNSEKSKAVRTEIINALAQLGESDPETRAGETAVGIDDLEVSLGSAKRRVSPAASWLDVSVLPSLYRIDGKVLSSALVIHLLAVQTAHKGLSVAPEIAPLLAQIDRARSGDFALALLDAWLASAQDAKDRWALVFVGALGDTRILSVLNSWIPKWCEKGRGKLAEYAAQAIALQGSDEALMLLDALATRYRSKQRNIGAAAVLAFQAAAEARGLSADELGDVVVPAFGFDGDGLRDFTWDGGAARAELGVDLKLSWSDPESDKALKGPPSSAPDALKSEVKELGKLLREAAKGQAARLELALVRQRRWPLARWRELYENHPVLRAFATRLVWGAYGADGALMRCFRRYPNGLLADAAGGLEELPETDALVGMVHPLELTTEAVAAWDAHLARFKVEPPFPQLARAVERLDPLHANRRELAVAKGRELGAGTFRSRAERRGWVRGSVVDAGGVAGYYKSFPGAGVEVTIETEGLYIDIDPMETVTLGVARFVRADTVKRGSYVYDDPQQGDERVLSFGAVPPVVYSETVGDLKAIAGIVASVDGEADGS